jgi:hypothetical protein
MELSSPRSTGVKYGLYMGLALAVFAIATFATGVFTNQFIGYASWLIVIAGVVLGLREYKSLNQGFMSFKHGVGVGAWAGLVGGVLEAIARFVYVSLNPQITDQLIAFARAELEKNPDVPAEQVDMAMNMTTSMMSAPAMSGLSLVGTLVLAVIVALIASAVMKQDPPELYDDMDNMGQ